MIVCQDISENVDLFQTYLSIRNARHPPWSIPAPFNMPKRHCELFLNIIPQQDILFETVISAIVVASMRPCFS